MLCADIFQPGDPEVSEEASEEVVGKVGPDEGGAQNGSANEVASDCF